MPRSSVAFAIQAPEDIARDRLRAVLRFYDPCGALEVRIRRDRALNLTVGEILIGADPPESAARAAAIFNAGERLPSTLSDPGAVLDASDAQLRALDGAQAVVAADEGRARIVSGAGGARTWFAAGDAYATSVAAAALLGGVAPFADVDSLPELLIFGKCLGERTHVKGVRALMPSTVVDFGSGEREIWPRLARWAAVDDKQAGAKAWQALVRQVSQTLERERSPWVLLDESGDGPLILAAAAEMGTDLPAFSLGDDFSPTPWTTTVAEARQNALAGVILGDGAVPLSPFETAAAPHTSTSVLTAFGAQIARPTAYPHGLIERTPADHRPALEIRLREWLAAADECGPENWSAFDMLLVEEGIDDARTPNLPFAVCEPMRSPEIARALSSISPEIRADADWRARMLSGFDVPHSADTDAVREGGWNRLTEISEWLIEEPLSHPLLTSALGDLWVSRLKEGIADREPKAREEALAAAAAVIFDQRLQLAAQPAPR